MRMGAAWRAHGRDMRRHESTPRSQIWTELAGPCQRAGH